MVQVGQLRIFLVPCMVFQSEPWGRHLFTTKSLTLHVLSSSAESLHVKIKLEIKLTRICMARPFLVTQASNLNFHRLILGTCFPDTL